MIRNFKIFIEQDVDYTCYNSTVNLVKSLQSGYFD